MNRLPQNSFFDGFYIWFNPDKKEEYFSTHLYFYYTQKNGDIADRRLFLELEKDISTVKPTDNEITYKHPATLYIPFVEQFGAMLINLLNADFSTFETSYNTFLYAYGFELLLPYSPDSKLLGKYESEVELIKNLKNIYEDSLDKLLEIQCNFRECVDFLYNLNGNTELENHKVNSKFVAYLVKHRNNIYTYSKDIEVTLDSYADKFYDYSKHSLEKLVSELDNQESIVQTTNTYTSPYLSNICYVVLEQFVKNSLLPIKTCKYCNRYFIPSIRQDEIYCDLPNIDGKSCREKGAKQTYKENLEKIPALLEYRKIYQKKFMTVSRSNGDKKLKKEFDNWKTKAQAKIKDFKQEKITEDELYQWMLENK